MARTTRYPFRGSSDRPMQRHRSRVRNSPRRRLHRPRGGRKCSTAADRSRTRARGQGPRRRKRRRSWQLTQEELDRRVQAETDRREAKRAARLEQQQRKQLRDTDPWAYAEEERKAEQAAQSNQSVAQWFQGLSSEHDRVAIDPLIETLPARRARSHPQDGRRGPGTQGSQAGGDRSHESTRKALEGRRRKGRRAQAQQQPSVPQAGARREQRPDGGTGAAASAERIGSRPDRLGLLRARYGLRQSQRSGLRR